MKEFSVSGQKRTATGKKASKLLRKEGVVPCNLYGESKDANGLPEALAFQVNFADIRKAIYTPHVYVLNLNIDGKEHKAIIKELQFHPTTDALLHADFYEVNEKKDITVGIPVNLTGHAKGVRDGGRLNLSIRKIDVTAPYSNIPEKLDIDVTNLELGKAIKVGSLQFEGLKIATSPEVVVCSVKATRASRAAAAAETAQ
ncbi:MAG: 50S ribosomal protein L25 [Prevotella sp.]|nr:50S ribosomal protein L25 [Prevotella sp.]